MIKRDKLVFPLAVSRQRPEILKDASVCWVGAVLPIRIVIMTTPHSSEPTDVRQFQAIPAVHCASVSLRERATRSGLWFLTFLPVLFFVLAVQYSALTFPFWDHCEFINDFAKLHDHTLLISDLWAPHVHSRPLTLRALILFNGSLTDWDIRSEYVYLIGSVIFAFLLQVFCLRRLIGRFSLRCVSLILLLSIVSFSPAGHNSHWWSLMLQFTLTHVFVIAAFLFICFQPRSWVNNILTALACWLAAYTHTYGLVAFVVAALIVQITNSRLLRFDRLTMFWCLNIAAVLALYLPGLNQSAGGIHLLSQAEFFLAFLGSPFVSLLSFPYRSMFDIPFVTLRNGVAGLILLTSSLYVIFLQRKQIEERSPAALLLVAFSFFAFGSGALTSMARAEFDAYGIANANASRYTLFSAYLLYALIYAAAADWRISELPGWLLSLVRVPRIKVAVACAGFAFLILAGVSYARSRVVYEDAHNFNRHLGEAFLNDDPAEQKNVYPNVAEVQKMKATLRRLNLGPYYVERSKAVGPSTDLLGTLGVNKLLDQFGVNGLRDLPTLGPVIFANPHSRFAVPGDQAKVVRFEFGIYDTALQATPPPDGVVFRVIVKRGDNGQESVLWTNTLRPYSETKDRGIHKGEIVVDAVKTDLLVFETLAVKNPGNNWAYWRNVASFK